MTTQNMMPTQNVMQPQAMMPPQQVNYTDCYYVIIVLFIIFNGEHYILNL
jgi:hypothetical protein